MSLVADAVRSGGSRHAAEAAHAQAEALFQTLLREAYAQASAGEAALIDLLSELPRADALDRLTGELAPGRPCPVPGDLGAALAAAIRELDPSTYPTPSHSW